MSQYSELTIRRTIIVRHDIHIRPQRHDLMLVSLFFFIDTATTHIYTFPYTTLFRSDRLRGAAARRGDASDDRRRRRGRSEEHTSELQSRPHLVCRLLRDR